MLDSGILYDKVPILFKIDAKTGEVFFFEYHIDIRKAKEIAAQDAGVFEEFSKLTFTIEEYVGGGIKTPYFYLVFNNDKTQWTYLIDATLGHVLDKSEVALLVSLQKAREIALKDAGITDENEVTFTKEELNKGPERPCWIIEFYNENYQYSYVIDAETGEILFSTRYVSIEKAKTIALQDTVLSDGSKVVFTVEELVAGGIKPRTICSCSTTGKLSGLTASTRRTAALCTATQKPLWFLWTRQKRLL